MARRRSNWLILPVGFSIAYGLEIWALWLPLRHAWIISHSGDASFIPYWEGEVIGSVAIQIFCMFLVCPVYLAIPIGPRVREAFAIGGLTGIATAIFDRFCGQWTESRLGLLTSVFGIPFAASAIFTVLLLYPTGRHARAGGETEPPPQ